MATSFGLVRQDGVAISGTTDWNATFTGGHVELAFDRDVANAVVVATHQTPYCDGLGGLEPIQIGKSQNPKVVCVYHVKSRFSFILMDANPRPEAKGVFD